MRRSAVSWCLVVLAAWGCNRNVAPPTTVLARFEGPVRSRDVIQGLNIYQTICAVCHAGRVNPEGYNWSPGQMRQQIRRGNRLMPPLGHELLSDAQVEAVLAYLVGTRAVEGTLPPIGQEDLARERTETEARREAERRRRAQLERDLDPALRETARDEQAPAMVSGEVADPASRGVDEVTADEPEPDEPEPDATPADEPGALDETGVALDPPRAG